MSNETTLTTEHLATLFDALIYERVRDAVDGGRLSALEEQLALWIVQIVDVTDRQLLEVPRGMIAKALRRIAGEREGAGMTSDEHCASPRVRYMNAVCREALGELDRADDAPRCTERAPPSPGMAR